jgi:superoxide dismutase
MMRKSGCHRSRCPASLSFHDCWCFVTHVDGYTGSLEGLKTRMAEHALGHFGSGWVWLICTARHELEVISYHDARTPAQVQGLTPLLVMDVWEHAYYVDHVRRGSVSAAVFCRFQICCI